MYREISKVLRPGEYVFVVVNKKVKRTRCVGVEPLGVDTAYDFLTFDTYRFKWFLTKAVALEKVKE